MNLRKLPPSMLLALGLACGDDEGSSDTAVDGCLTPGMSGTLSGCLDIGPCLSPPTTSSPGTSTGSADSSTGDVSTGPCLSPPEETTDTDSATGPASGTDTGTGTGTGTGTSTDTGMMSDQPTSRTAAMERVLERGALPPDVAARLRRMLDE